MRCSQSLLSYRLKSSLFVPLQFPTPQQATGKIGRFHLALPEGFPQDVRAASDLIDSWISLAVIVYDFYVCWTKQSIYAIGGCREPNQNTEFSRDCPISPISPRTIVPSWNLKTRLTNVTVGRVQERPINWPRCWPTQVSREINQKVSKRLASLNDVTSVCLFSRQSSQVALLYLRLVDLAGRPCRDKADDHDLSSC